MGQRLGIAAALQGDPPVPLFDEPINGLVPDGILWARNLLKDLVGSASAFAPWTGFAVLCAYVAATLGVGIRLVAHRDA